jgi:hypothetical protein
MWMGQKEKRGFGFGRARGGCPISAGVRKSGFRNGDGTTSFATQFQGRNLQGNVGGWYDAGRQADGQTGRRADGQTLATCSAPWWAAGYKLCCTHDDNTRRVS